MCISTEITEVNLSAVVLQTVSWKFLSNIRNKYHMYVCIYVYVCRYVCACVCMCMCVCVCECVCVCVSERERERDTQRETERERQTDIIAFVTFKQVLSYFPAGPFLPISSALTEHSTCHLSPLAPPPPPPPHSPRRFHLVFSHLALPPHLLQ